MPPDGFDWGLVVPPPITPPTTLWPTRSRPEIIVDCWGVMLADAQGNLIGFDTDWGGGRPAAKMIQASRTSTAGPF